MRGNLLRYHREAGNKLDRNDSLDIATALALLGEYQAASERLGGITEKENSDSYPYSSRVSLAAHNLVRLKQLEILWQNISNDPQQTQKTISRLRDDKHDSAQDEDDNSGGDDSDNIRYQYRENRDDRHIAAFTLRGEPRAFSYTILGRTTRAGTWHAPGATIENMYHPEEHARQAAQTVVVVE